MSQFKTTIETKHSWPLYVISALGHHRQEDQDYKSCLCYLDNPKLVWATRDFIKNKNKTKATQTHTQIIRLKDGGTGLRVEIFLF